MELPKNMCISCAYFCEEADEYIPIIHRIHFLDDQWDKEWMQKYYTKGTCYKNQLQNFYKSGKTTKDIHNIIARVNKCKHWVQFVNGVTPIATEQREASVKSRNWAKWAFWISLAILIATALILVYTLKSYYS